MSAAPPEAAIDVAANLAHVHEKMAEAARAAGRDPDGVALVAVTKTMGPERILPALEAGHRLFGENRVEEAAEKWPDIRARYPDIRVHLIGSLQSRKAADAVRLFDCIETLDRLKIARRVAAAMAEQGRRPDCLVQVNTGEEPQKGGVAPTDADAFIARCRRDFGLPIRGLMCLPPIDQEPAPHFALLAKIARRNGLSVLSMGMTADYGIAIQFGATHVRIGTAIFGPREG